MQHRQGVVEQGFGRGPQGREVLAGQVAQVRAALPGGKHVGGEVEGEIIG